MTTATARELLDILIRVRNRMARFEPEPELAVRVRELDRIIIQAWEEEYPDAEPDQYYP